MPTYAIQKQNDLVGELVDSLPVSVASQLLSNRFGCEPVKTMLNYVRIRVLLRRWILGSATSLNNASSFMQKFELRNDGEKTGKNNADDVTAFSVSRMKLSVI